MASLKEPGHVESDTGLSCDLVASNLRESSVREERVKRCNAGTAHAALVVTAEGVTPSTMRCELVPLNPNELTAASRRCVVGQGSSLVGTWIGHRAQSKTHESTLQCS